MNLWQLKKITTKENLSEPQPLPENWGPIFGMHNIKDKLGNLSWLGDPELEDMGWFDTGMPVPEPSVEVIQPVSAAEATWTRAKQLLAESDWSMLPDVPMTKQKKYEWELYRRELREIRSQSGFPDSIAWPNKPE